MVARVRFELTSKGPKPSILVRWTTGLQLTLTAASPYKLLLKQPDPPPTMPVFTVRKATHDDEDELYEMRLLLQRHGEGANPTIWRLTQKGEEKMRKDVGEMLRDEDGVVLVAEMNGTRIGFAYGRHTCREEYAPPNIGQVALIFIKKPYRTHGVGSLLMAELCMFFDSKGVQDVTLNYIRGNVEAAGFWGSLGFEHRIYVAGTPLKDLKSHLGTP
jgi:GNAT superfamily N-acetyltransferase